MEDELIDILVADNHQATRQAMVEFLTSVFPGLDIRQARNGYEVLDLVAAKRPDLILMDIEMPQLDGLQATRQIKASWPQVKIIAMATHQKESRAALEAGAETYLFKGSRSETLRDAVFVVLADEDG